MGIFDIDPISNMHWFYCHWCYITCILQHAGNDYNLIDIKLGISIHFICNAQFDVSKRIWKEKNYWN